MIDAFYPLLWAYKQVFESSNHIFVNLILHLGGPKNLNFAHQHCFKREIPLLGISPKAFEKVKKGLGMRKICQEFSRQKCIKFWMRLRFASSGANHQKIILCNVYEKSARHIDNTVLSLLSGIVSCWYYKLHTCIFATCWIWTTSMLGNLNIVLETWI